MSTSIPPITAFDALNAYTYPAQRITQPDPILFRRVGDSRALTKVPPAALLCSIKQALADASDSRPGSDPATAPEGDAAGISGVLGIGSTPEEETESIGVGDAGGIASGAPGFPGSQRHEAVDEDLPLNKRSRRSSGKTESTTRPNGPLPPCIKFVAADNLIARLDQRYTDLVDPSTIFPQPCVEVNSHDALQSRYYYDRVENDCYRHTEEYLLLLHHILLDPGFHVLKRPLGRRFWGRCKQTRSKAETKTNTGLADYEIAGIHKGKAIRHPPIWEMKTVSVMAIKHLIWMRNASAGENGIRLYVDEDDFPRWHWPEGEWMADDVSRADVEDLLEQVLVELDASQSGMLLLSSWDASIVISRPDPDLLHISKMICRDTAHELSTLGYDIDDHENALIEGNWNPVKLYFTVLITAGEDEFCGYVRGHGIYFPDRRVGLEDVEREARRAAAPLGDPDRYSEAGPSGTGSGMAAVPRDDDNDGGGYDDDVNRTVLRVAADQHFPNTTLNTDWDTWSAKDHPPVTPDHDLPTSGSSSASFGLTFSFDVCPVHHRMRHSTLGQNWKAMRWDDLAVPKIFDDDGDPARNSLSHHDDDDITGPSSVERDHRQHESIIIHPNDNPPHDHHHHLGRQQRLRLSGPAYYLKLNSYINHGRLYDAYRSTLLIRPFSHSPPNPARSTCTYTKMDYRSRNQSAWTSIEVISKLVDLSTFPTFSTDPYEYSADSAKQAVVNEICLYKGALRRLQGTTVPNLVGCWSSGSWVCVCLEDVGEGWDGSSTLSEDQKSEIVLLYRQLHSLPVLHGDVQPRHIRFSAKGPRLIDFEASADLSHRRRRRRRGIVGGAAQIEGMKDSDTKSIGNELKLEMLAVGRMLGLCM